MMHKVFTIHDEKAKAFLPPFFLPNEGMAIRTFGDCVNSDSHQFGVHPEDYRLFQIGVFDDESGELDSFAPRIISCGIELVGRSRETGPQETGLTTAGDEEIEAARIRLKQVSEINK